MNVSKEAALPDDGPEASSAEVSRSEDSSQNKAEGASCKSKHSLAASTDSLSSSYTPTLYHVDTNTTIVLNAELITSKAQKVLCIFLNGLLNITTRAQSGVYGQNLKNGRRVTKT